MSPPLVLPRSVEKIIIECAMACNVTSRMVVSSSSAAPIVAARRMAARRMRREMRLSTPLIGRYLGGMHHTSVLHLLKTDGPRRKLIEIDLPLAEIPWSRRDVPLGTWDEWAI